MHLNTSSLPRLDMGFCGCTCNWGTHFCGLYESKAERDDIMVGFLAQGLREKELLVCCPDEGHHDHVLGHLIKRCPEEAPPDDESLRLLSAQELYYPKGHFSPVDMIRAHDGIWAENQAKGLRNVRGTAEMGWALEKIPGVEHLMVYESMLNHFIWGKQWISICLYDVNRFPGSTVMKVLQVHPFVITGGGIYENPFFIQPEAWLKKYAPKFLSDLKRPD